MTGIAAQYDESIEGWNLISWPETSFKSRLYKRFGSVSVYLLNPLLWSYWKDVTLPDKRYRRRYDAI